jgi:hypothetical protein
MNNDNILSCFVRKIKEMIPLKIGWPFHKSMSKDREGEEGEAPVEPVQPGSAGASPSQNSQEL